MNYRDIDIFGYSFGGEVLKRIAELGDDVREAYNRLVQAGYPSSTAEKIATGELPMDSASKAARMQEQGYTTPAFSGSTFDIRQFRTSGANPESDFGRGTYATTSPLDATANYAGVGPDLTQRIQLQAERLADLADDEYSLGEMLDEVGLTLDDYYADEAGALEKVARAQLLGDAPGGVTYPLRINTQNYAVIGGDNPSVLTETRDYVQEAKQALGEAADEDDIFEYADDLRFNDDQGLYARIREALAETDIYQDEQAINSVLEEIAGDIAEGDVRIADIDAAIRRNVSEAYDEATGDLLSPGEISRQTIQNLGFEGIIDNTVDMKFGTNRKGFGGAKIPGMEGVTPETAHIITFPGQEKNIRSQFAAFDPDQRRNPNILAGLGAGAIGTLGAGAIGTAALAAPQDALAAEQGDVPAYMRRLDGTIKSERGFLGPIQNKVSGRTMTEVSIGQPGSEEGFYPLLVPTLTPEEIDIISNMDLERDRPPMSIIQKARAHAMDRINQGLSPFYQDGEEGDPMALNDIDIFEQFSQLSPEAEALLSRSAEGMVMTPGGPVRADAGPTEAQALNFAGLMTGIGGVVDLLGGYPQMPAEGVSFKEMLAGETNPSLLENLQQGNYLDTGLQLLGAIPLVGAAAKGGARGVTSLSRSVMPAPQRMFDPNDPAFKPFLKDFEYQPGGRYLEMGPGGPRDVSGEIPAAASISVDATGKPSMLISEDTLTSLPAPTRGRKVKANLFKKKAGWNWTQAPEGFDPNPPSSFPLVSVETGGRHFYSLKTDFPDGVELARYPQSKTEPRLRPTVTKGDVELGNVVGEISVRGKTHPVYDEVRVVAGMEPDPALRYLPQVGRPTFAPEVVQREGKDAFKELERMLKAHQNDLTTGADMVARAERINPGFQDRVREVSSLLGLEKVETSGVKSLKSIEEKLGRKPYGPEGITDPIRTRIYVNTVEEADEAARLIGERMPTLDGGFQMIPETGYFDRKLNVQYTSPEGEQLLGEIQLIPKPMSEAAETGHRMYEVARKLEERYGSANDIPMSHIRRFEEMQRKQRELYGAASEDIDESIVRSIVPKFARGGYVGSSGRSSPMIPYSFWKDSSLKGLPSLKKSRTMRLFA